VARGRVLPRSFYDRPSLEVARDLLGCVVESETDDGPVAVRLVEVEAYAGEEDAASHAWRGRTPRTDVMYGNPGHAYVYFTYGMHWCVNTVCREAGTAAAVLLRAGEVVDGADLARARRGDGVPPRRLASGPANLAKALGLDGRWSGDDVTGPRGRLRVRAGVPVPDDDVVASPRVGISRATELPWRLSLRGDPFVSAPRP
jgi:DNA-3-methyladenine glycosylase